MAVKAKAEITLSHMIDVVGTYRYYLLQSSTASAPSKPTTHPPAEIWDDTEPNYTSGSTNSLYFVDCSVYSNGTFYYSPVSLSTSYEAAKEAYNKAENAQNTANDAQSSLEENMTEVYETIRTQSTNIIDNSEAYIIEALKSYVETGNYYEFQQTVESQLALLAEQITLKFTETIDQINNVNGDLQEKFNTITKYFTFDINGMTIGQVDNPKKILIDNDEINILVNGVPVQTFDANGNAQMPSLNVTQKFNLLGYLIEKDDNFNVNCDYIGVPFFIIQQPTGGSITAGVANTSVVVSGEIMSYQWQYDLTGTGVFQDLPENPTPTQYTASKTAKLIPPGPYTFRCVITDVSGNTITSNAVKVDA